jgi:aerobic carbon-monoxide dehydrogenase medium subunit
VRPVDFTLHMPRTATEAVALLGGMGDDAVVLAGGQTLMPLLNMRVVRPTHVVDLGQVRELDYIRRREDGALTIGAMTRQRQLANSGTARSIAPLLAHSASFVGQPSTRSRGTVGGSVAFGSNVSEICVALLALDGEIGVQAKAARRIAAERFFVGYLTTALAPGELVAEIAVPVGRPRMGWGFSELKLRACDFPIVVAAVVLASDAGGVCRHARVALGGVAMTPIRSPAAEEALIGRPVDVARLEEATRLAHADLSPPTDLHAPADYRRRAAAVHLRLALGHAAQSLKEVC